MPTSDTDILTQAAAIARGLAIHAVHGAQGGHRPPAAPRRRPGPRLTDRDADEPRA
jgi:hypothetical protein